MLLAPWRLQLGCRTLYGSLVMLAKGILFSLLCQSQVVSSRCVESERVGEINRADLADRFKAVLEQSVEN